MLIYAGDPYNKLITASRGAGDNLTTEDIENGFVDSAQIMTTKLIKDMDEEEQIKTLRDYWELTGDYVILER